jgi:hypothetical protein
MSAFEELSVAEEELRAQQETLVETHNLLRSSATATALCSISRPIRMW